MSVLYRASITLGAAALALSVSLPATAKMPVPIPRPQQTAVQASVSIAGPGRVAAKPIAALAPLSVSAPSGISGWMAVDLDTGEIVDQSQADSGFAPASVAKLPTAAFALDALGSDHRFETRMLATGVVRGGELQGDLVLQGGGDPEFDTDALLPMARDLASRGIHSISGDLLADGSALPQVSEITRAQEVEAAYNPSVSGLNLNFNRVHLKWDARKGNDRLSVEAASARLSPPVEIVQVALASQPGAPLFSFQEQDGHEIWQMARWAYRGQAARWLPVKRPEIYAADVFRKLSVEQGIALPQPQLGQAPADADLLAVHRSRPLGDILRDMLKHSTNLTAEVTGSAATAAAGLQAQTLANSAEVMNAWAAHVAGFPVGDPGFRFVNHSGLTLDSRVSPRRMVELLTALARRAETGKGQLPGGVAGYLRDYNVGEKAPAGLQVAAKTGTMSYVRGLSGYVVTPKGRRLAFAIFSNDLARRGDGPERVDQGWMGRAKAFERALIRSWVQKAESA